MGHFVSSPREREKRDKEIVEDERERRGERKMNDSGEKEEIKNIPLLPLPAARTAGFAQM